MTDCVIRAPDDVGAERSATAEDLFPQVYNELRRLAGDYLRRERPGHTLQPTALVHEAYLKLVGQRRAVFKSRTHFFAVGARIMRQLLIDHARKRHACKRGGGWQKITLAEGVAAAQEQTIDLDELVALEGALVKLAKLDERAAQVVTLRLFGGLSAEEAAEALGVSRRTVSNDWRHAQAWLRSELARTVEP